MSENYIGYTQIHAEDNSIKWIHNKTGEIIENININIPAGTSTITPEQREINRQYWKSQQEVYAKRRMVDELGYFYFILRQEAKEKISPATSARLIYLFTFLNLNNRFMQDNRKPVKQKDIAGLLKISRSTAFTFWDEVKGKYIDADKQGNIILTDESIVSRKGTTKGRSYQRIYINAVRSLYLRSSNVSTKRHKQLGYVFQLLPYINIEYNVLCKNAMEKELEKIELITINEFCDLVGYSKNHRGRVMATYESLDFVVGGYSESFLSFVKYYNDYRIFINPHILYSGSNYREVKVLGLFGNKRNSPLSGQLKALK